MKAGRNDQEDRDMVQMSLFEGGVEAGAGRVEFEGMMCRGGGVAGTGLLRCARNDGGGSNDSGGGNDGEAVVTARLGLEMLPGPVASARCGDPLTSIEAAERHERSGCARTNRERVLEVVRAFPGLASSEIARIAGMERHEAARRLPEVAARGWIKQEGVRRVAVEGGGERSLGVAWWPTTEHTENAEKNFHHEGTKGTKREEGNRA